MTRKLILITDIHLCPPGKRMFGIDPAERFAAALAHAQATHPDAEHVIVMGDLANCGARQEYERVRAVLDAVALPVTLMPGNHDNRDALLAVFPESETTPEGHVQSVIALGEDRLITLDTLDGPPFVEHHAIGVMCAARLAWLERALADAAGRRVLLFMHHPPYEVGIERLDCIGLADREAFLEIVRAAGNVAHIFSGHVHRTISGNLDGIAVSLLKSTLHQLPFHAGRPGDRPGGPEAGAYGVIILTPQSVILHSEEFGGGAMAEDQPAPGGPST
ncbi:MAG: metallophosphoesterase [Paracoccaceae bacterium]